LQRFSVVLGIFVISAVGWPLHPAQADGHADISRPAAGASVSGVVTILGSASSSSFDHYELSFAFDPNPTDTWFPIGEPVSTQVSFGRLGLWDTSGITDGTYALRLTVVLEGGGVVEDVVGGIMVRSTVSAGSPAGSGTPASSVEPAIEAPISGLATALTEPAAATELSSPDREPRGRGIDVAGVAIGGAVASALGLLVLGAYVLVRRSIRQRWGVVRSHKMYTGASAEERRESKRG